MVKDSRNPLDSWSKACADFGGYSRNPLDSWSKIRVILLVARLMIRVILLIRGQWLGS